MQRATAIRWVLIAALLLAVVAAALALPQALPNFVQWARRQGAWGPAMVALAYLPACLLFLPGSLLTLASGYAFGVWRTTLAVSLGSTVGATAAFVVGRTLARGFVERLAARTPGFQAIDRAVATQGFKMVLLLRLSPVVPFNLLNYALGLTGVRLRDYVLASWIGMLPGTLLYAYLGSAVESLAALGEQPLPANPWREALFYAGLLATLLATVLITRAARRALQAAQQAGPGGTGMDHVPAAD